LLFFSPCRESQAKYQHRDWEKTPSNDCNFIQHIHAYIKPRSVGDGKGGGAGLVYTNRIDIEKRRVGLHNYGVREQHSTGEAP
jgi:hypothetical protein